MTSECCLECRYFIREGAQINPIIGQCRRYPPSIPESGRYASMSNFPTVPEGFWCGEFKFKKEKLPKDRLVRDE